MTSNWTLDTFSLRRVTPRRRASKDLHAKSLVPSRSVLSRLIRENSVTLCVDLLSGWRTLLSREGRSPKLPPPPRVTTSVVLTSRGAAQGRKGPRARREACRGLRVALMGARLSLTVTVGVGRVKAQGEFVRHLQRGKKGG